MAKRKQNKPKKATKESACPQNSDVDDLELKTLPESAEVHGCNAHKKVSSTVNEWHEHTLLESQHSSGVKVGEVGLMNVIYYNDIPIYDTARNCTLQVRLRFRKHLKHGFGGLHEPPMEDIHVDVLTISIADASPFLLLSGNLDAPDVVAADLSYLIVKGYMGLFPNNTASPSGEWASLDRFHVVIEKDLFEANISYGSHLRPIWRKKVRSVLTWLRPELSIESIYGEEVAKGTQNGDTKQFDPVVFYEAMKRSRNEPALDKGFDELLINLRPYQQRAVYWMVQREIGGKHTSKALSSSDGKHAPLLWTLVESVDGSNCFFYNPFSGSVSTEPQDHPSYVRGGILADEMGLGKTVEILACILSNPYRSSTLSISNASDTASKDLQRKLSKRKRVRVECPCGAIEEGSHEGIWVQCDCCDAWQHAACVGYGFPSPADLCYKTPIKNSRKRSKTRLETNRCTGKGNNGLYEVDDIHICGQCSELIGGIEVTGESGATLIVCPTPILDQWQEEITRHTRRGSLRVMVYNGVRRGCHLVNDDHGCKLKVVGAHDLAMADIVLTTYDILREDLFHDIDDGNGKMRSMRFQKRYRVVPTPLTRLLWWRICLDEAQMVENNAANVTEMALRLHAQNRWCVSGTPIQRGLDDMFGLLKFLQAAPFDNYYWWNQALKIPYEEGRERAVKLTHTFFRGFMWRSTKDQVADELNLPPQQQNTVWLTFSPIEAHYYQRQHERCARKVNELIARWMPNPSMLLSEDSKTRETSENVSNTSIPGASTPYIASDRPLSHDEVAKLLNLLLRLRQACCHPQVGSAGIRSLQGAPMTMDEILEVLIEKSKTEGEEAQRALLSALNGLAAVAIAEENWQLAVSTYREALSTAEENSAYFRVDPLQKLHVLHNLAEVLSSGKAKGIPRTLRDDLLLQHCKDIREKYMAPFQGKLGACREEFLVVHRKVVDFLAKDGTSHGSTWWLDVLSLVQQKGDGAKELVAKIHDALHDIDVFQARDAFNFARRFRDLDGLKLLLQTELDAIDQLRKNLFERLLEMDAHMDSPSDSEVKKAGSCDRCTESDGAICSHCVLDDLFQAYESRLFLVRAHSARVDRVVSAEDAIAAHNRSLLCKRIGKGNSEFASTNCMSGNRNDGDPEVRLHRHRSQTETILKTIRTYGKLHLPGTSETAAKEHLQALVNMRKEFAQAKQLALSQRRVMCALDELGMSIARFYVRKPQGSEPADPLRLHPEEVPEKNAQFTADKFAAVTDLSRLKGQLRYLKGIAQERNRTMLEDNVQRADKCIETGYKHGEEVSCPVCQEKLGAELMIFPCGHFLCCNCVVMMVDRVAGGAEQKARVRIACPTCRSYTFIQNIAYVKDENKKSEDSGRLVNNLREADERNIRVNGSYGTKIEAVVQRILLLRKDDPTTKVLVFSTWNDVLAVVEHALIANSITVARIKGRSTMHATIKKFKGESLEKGEPVRQTDKSTRSLHDSGAIQVLLLPILRGANGLNIVEAQHVILMEPLLNPALEMQAINRIHRIGQSHSTFVHRFIVNDTVEDGIYKLCQKHNRGKTSALLPRHKEQIPLTLGDVNSIFEQDSCQQEMVESSNHLSPRAAAAMAAVNRCKSAT